MFHEAIPLTDIVPSPTNPRKTFGQAELEELAQSIHREILSDLKHARWSVKDETLVPEAGSCLACPKRSGATPQLFPELNTKTDLCLDKGCFQTKLDAWIKREAEEKGAVRTTSEYGSKTKLPYSYHLPRIEKGRSEKCEHSTMAVVVDGREKGDKFRTCVDPKCKVHAGKKDGPSARVNKEEALRKKATKAENAFRAAVFAALDETVQANAGGLSLGGVTLAAVAHAVYGRLEHIERGKVDTYLEMPKDRWQPGLVLAAFKAKNDQELLSLLIRMVAMREIRANAYSDTKAEELLGIAKQHGVDVAAIAAENPEARSAKAIGKPKAKKKGRAA